MRMQALSLCAVLVTQDPQRYSACGTENCTATYRRFQICVASFMCPAILVLDGRASTLLKPFETVLRATRRHSARRLDPAVKLSQLDSENATCARSF